MMPARAKELIPRLWELDKMDLSILCWYHDAFGRNPKRQQRITSTVNKPQLYPSLLRNRSDLSALDLIDPATYFDVLWNRLALLQELHIPADGFL